MPKKSSVSSVAEQNPSRNGVLAVDRALSVLRAFSASTPTLRLNELAERTRLHKSTVLRMLASLEHAYLVQRGADGAYSLGSGIQRLHQIYTASFSLEDIVMPILRQLVETTQESAALHVRQGDQRICLHRVDSPRPVRDHLKVGDVLPLDQGAGGRVLLAYSGAAGALYDQIRKEGAAMLAGDRIPEIAGIASPVFDAAGDLAGALVLSMPAERLNPDHADAVRNAARRITEGLGGDYADGSSDMIIATIQRQ